MSTPKDLSTQNRILQKAHPRLLIVDDQPINITQMNTVFPSNYEIFMATSGEQALEICANSKPDLILLDIVMPKMSGLDLCHILKRHANTRDIPVIFVTTLHSMEEESACWEAGGVDFVTKPVNFTTLQNRVKVHLTLKFQNEMLSELTRLDPLTGIANRRAFDERIVNDFNQSKRMGTPLSLLIIDIDFFKSYNDQYGHQAGDECLRKIARLLKSKLHRAMDLVARYGGEEFVCLLPNTNQKNALEIAEKLRITVQNFKFKQPKSKVLIKPTISIGLATYPDALFATCEAFIETADKRLYEAKALGRNRVCG